MMYSLKEIIEVSRITECEIGGEWVPYRPVAYPGLYGFWMRIKAAWKVATGRADAVVWPGGQ